MGWQHQSPIEGAVPQARRLRTRMTSSEQKLWKELRKLDKMIRFTDREVFSDVHGCADKTKALLLDGGGLGGGARSELAGGREWAPAPNGASDVTALHTPPFPALPPSRRKGETLPARGVE